MTSDILPYMYIYTVYEIKVQHKLCIKEKNPQLCISQWPMFTSEWVHTVWSMTVNDREKKNLWNVSNFSKRILHKIF